MVIICRYSVDSVFDIIFSVATVSCLGNWFRFNLQIQNVTRYLNRTDLISTLDWTYWKTELYYAIYPAIFLSTVLNNKIKILFWYQTLSAIGYYMKLNQERCLTSGNSLYLYNDHSYFCFLNQWACKSYSGVICSVVFQIIRKVLSWRNNLNTKERHTFV